MTPIAKKTKIIKSEFNLRIKLIVTFCTDCDEVQELVTLGAYVFNIIIIIIFCC